MGDMDFLENARFDCIVLGTAMCESLLASAICLNGQSVLHMDNNDFYGGSVSSANLEQSLKRWASGTPVSSAAAGPVPSLNEIASSLSAMGVSAREEELSFVSMSYRKNCRTVTSSRRSGPGIVGTTRNGKIYHPASYGYVMERQAKDSDDCRFVHPAFFGYRKDKIMTTERAFHHSRHFSIDESPRLLLSYGKMVDAMLTSGVNSYMEFVSIEGVYIPRPKAKPSSLTPSDVDVDLVSVPCSKADVFKSKLLTGLEKRALMKLLQIAVDYGNRLKGVDASFQNESTLVQGRALHRPQNTHEPDGKSALDILSENSLKDKSFSQFLHECCIPKHLQDIVMYAMCLSKKCDIPASLGLKFLYRHIYASGRLGETAFLYPIYGTTEISESFCRSAAVQGAVYALRQNVMGVVMKEYFSRAQASLPHNDETIAETFVETESSLSLPAKQVAAVILNGGKIMACDKLIINASNFCSVLGCGGSHISGAQSEVVRVSVCVGDQLLPVGRGLVVLPPNTGALNNPYPVYILQLNSSAMVCPQGCYLLYIITLVDGSFDELNDLVVSTHSGEIFNYLTAISAPAVQFNEIYYHVKVTEYVDNSAEGVAEVLDGDCRLPQNCGIIHNSFANHTIVMDEAVESAKELYDTIYTDNSFFSGPLHSSATKDLDDESQLLMDT